jgi:hypothetical protein
VKNVDIRAADASSDRAQEHLSRAGLSGRGNLTDLKVMGRLNRDSKHGMFLVD